MSTVQHNFSLFARRVETNGSWTVFDASTGRPAEVGSRQTTGMQIGDAQELVDILNGRYCAAKDPTTSRRDDLT